MGCSQRGDFLDLAEDSLAGDDTDGPSLQHLPFFFFFLQEMIRSSLRTSGLCVLIVAFEGGTVPHRQVTEVTQLDWILWRVGFWTAMAKAAAPASRSLCRPQCSWVLTTWGDPGGFGAEEQHDQTLVWQALSGCHVEKALRWVRAEQRWPVRRLLR